jgi:ComF family protein
MFRALPLSVNQKTPGKLTIARVRATLGALLVPPNCLLCGAAGLPGPIDLCAGCLADLPGNASPLQSEIAGYQLICCPWQFAFPIDELVRGLKFHGERCHARLLGTLLARTRLTSPLPLPQRVVPVPLHPRRLAERGYNQAAELAKFAARELGIQCEPRCLQRLRATREQSHLGAAARAVNLRQAFHAPRPLAFASVALVDDVMTTGSTAAAAAAALRAAGAAHVELWVVAQAQRRSATRHEAHSGRN